MVVVLEVKAGLDGVPAGVVDPLPKENPPAGFDGVVEKEEKPPEVEAGAAAGFFSSAAAEVEDVVAGGAGAPKEKPPAGLVGVDEAKENPPVVAAGAGAGFVSLAVAAVAGGAPNEKPPAGLAGAAVEVAKEKPVDAAVAGLASLTAGKGRANDGGAADLEGVLDNVDDKEVKEIPAGLTVVGAGALGFSPFDAGTGAIEVEVVSGEAKLTNPAGELLLLGVAAAGSGPHSKLVIVAGGVPVDGLSCTATPCVRDEPARAAPEPREAGEVPNEVGGEAAAG